MVSLTIKVANGTYVEVEANRLTWAALSNLALIYVLFRTLIRNKLATTTGWDFVNQYEENQYATCFNYLHVVFIHIWYAYLYPVRRYRLNLTWSLSDKRLEFHV